MTKKNKYIQNITYTPIKKKESFAYISDTLLNKKQKTKLKYTIQNIIEMS